MAKQTPDQIAAKWANRLSGSTQQIQDGVMNVTQSPTAKAAANPQKYLQGVQNGVAKWQAGLQKVSLSDWQQATISKGIPRISQGAQAAQPKFTQFMSKLQPFQDNLQKSIQGMPNMTLADSGNRMLAWMNGMSKFQK